MRPAAGRPQTCAGHGRAELTVRELGHTIHAHPTFSEAWMETAHAVHGEAIHAPPKRKK
ncbi:MAG: hypothetical protein WCK27_22675 [Verrucomicrobiota bacterium]